MFGRESAFHNPATDLLEVLVSFLEFLQAVPLPAIRHLEGADVVVVDGAEI